MPCYHPVLAPLGPDGKPDFGQPDTGHGSIELPCGGCIGCRLQRATDWALRCMHEASLYRRNCAVTLTYDDAHLPSSLQYRDFQLFMMRLRKNNPGVRFYMCGEYGEQFNRPHFHACLFNFDFTDKQPFGSSKSGTELFISPTLSKLWPYGFSQIGILDYQTAHYIARYCFVKKTGDQAEAHYGGKTPEFNRMSNRPGIGAAWLRRFRDDCFPCDYIVRDGKKFSVPRYYDKLNKRHDEAELEHVKVDRANKAAEHRADQTPERLRVREEVQRAALSFKTRT